MLVTRQGGHGLEDPRMVVTLLVSVAAFTLMFAWLLMLRLTVLRTRSRISEVARAIAIAEFRAKGS